MNKHLDRLFERRPELRSCAVDIERVVATLQHCFQSGHRAYFCGNGGSAADADHWAGELLKGFYSKRRLSAEDRQRLPSPMADQLQGGLPAIPLTGFIALRTAVANDIVAELEFAQLVWALGQKGDVLVALSTSGNARNVIAAAEVAHARGMSVIGFTGGVGGELKKVADISVRTPSDTTHEIQEHHLAIYHAVSLTLRGRLFSRQLVHRGYPQ